MKTSYKFWYITRDDDGYITHATINFFEGDIIKANEINIDGKVEEVTKYRRTKRLSKADLDHLSGSFIKDGGGYDSVLYTQKELGKIKTTDELRVFVNKELAKDTKRDPEDAQKETKLDKIKLLKIK